MTSKEHQQFMKMAAQASVKSVETNEGGPFGAVIVKNGQVIACEGNAVTKSNDPTAHAEVNAIRAACQILKSPGLEGCVMYTSCEPCPMCTSAIYWAKIDVVYYGNTKEEAAQAGFEDTFISEELSRPIDERRIKFSRIGAEICKKAFEEWMEKPAKDRAAVKKGTL